MQQVVIPVDVSVLFSHAILQAIADERGVDLLHIKGPAVHESLLDREPADDGSGEWRTIPRGSVDADVLVRPSHVDSFLAGMRSHGWELAYDFRDGSAFHHAATWVRDGTAHVDVHRHFPGMGADPERVFSILWSDRQVISLAGRDCQAPSVTAQRLVLLLHAVRGGQLLGRDHRMTWGEATHEERADLDALAARVGATVAVAAGTGRIEAYRTDRQYALWKSLAGGESSLLRMWWARIRAAPSATGAVRAGVALVLPNPRRMQTQLGHRPTRRDIASAYAARLRQGVGELRKLSSNRRGR